MDKIASARKFSPAAQLMAVEVISELLVSASPHKLGEVLAEHVRELSGAKTVMLLAHRPVPATDELLNVSPVRRANIFSPAELDNFCFQKNPGDLPISLEGLPASHPLKDQMERAGVQSMARYPLFAGGGLVGLLLLFDLPEPERVAEINQIIHLLAPAIALALKNALAYRQIEQQAQELDRRVEQRTAELQEAQALFRIAVGSSPIPLMIYDEDDSVLQLSVGWTNLSGYTLEDIPTVGDWTERAYGERTGTKKDYIDNLFAIDQTVNNGEWTVTAKYGSRRIWEFQTVPLGRVSKGKRVLLSMAVDITERKQAEELLRASEERLRVTLDATQIADWDWDIAHDLWYASPKFSTMLGYEPENGPLDRNTWLDRLHPQDRGLVEDKIRQTLGGQEARYEYEARMLHADGSYRWHRVLGRIVEKDEQGKATRMLGVRMDITEHKRAEIALRESEELHRTILLTAMDGFWLLDTQGRILEVNATYCRMSGYSAPELQAMCVTDLDAAETAVDVAAHLQRVLAQGADRFESKHRRKDGSIFDVEVGVQYQSVDGGRLVAFLRDITQRKLAEEQLAAKQRLLEELNLHLEQRVADAVLDSRKKDQILILQSRQAAMGEMIGNIAHQWRQPLNTLGLIVQELRMTYGRDEFTTEYLDASVKKAMKWISYMSKTIDDFSNYFKPGSSKMLFNVNQMVAKTLSLVEPSLGKNDIIIEVNELDNVDIDGYANEYSQVLLNILLNCRDAFERRDKDRQRIVRISILKENNKSVVTIADNAGGIPEDIMDKIFDPYFTTKGPDKGTGIGLYMAKAIMEKNMNGKLTVRNLADGAEFRIEV
jgi:PAS domain S-box-containing protein